MPDQVAAVGEDRWLTPAEAAAYLSIGVEPLYQLVHVGRVKAFKLGGRLRFRRADLDAALTVRKPHPAPTAKSDSNA